MPRQARLLFAGHSLHVVHRGVNRGACFADDADRSFYLGLLQELLPASGCALHAYVLMTNHVHLLVTPAEDDSAARLMKPLAQRYAQRCNRKWKRTGPFWEGRFKSSLVESCRYALDCHRYGRASGPTPWGMPARSSRRIRPCRRFRPTPWNG